MITQQPLLFASKPDTALLTEGISLARNWHLTSIPVWSRDLSATLEVSADIFPEPVPLIIELCVFDSSPNQPRNVILSSTGHTDTQIMVQGPAPVRVLVLSPMQTNGIVTLTLDSITSPLQAGMSADDRLLGLQIRTLIVAPDALSLPLNLSDPNVAGTILGHGWAAVDAGVGVWSIAQRANLVVPGYLRQPDMNVARFTMDVLNRDETCPPLGMEVFCNGIFAATWRSDQNASNVLECPLIGWDDNTDLLIEFRFADLRSPQDLGINADVRSLGVMLKEIELVCEG